MGFLTIEFFVGVLVGTFLSVVLTSLFKKLGKSIVLLCRQRSKRKDKIIGIYYGYYLSKNDDKSEVEVRKSFWTILPSIKKDTYKIITQNSNKELRYTGEMRLEHGHYIIKLQGEQPQLETIYERRLIVKNPELEPIVGLSLAINSAFKIRVNFSILSKEEISIQKFRKIIDENRVFFDDQVCNLIVDN